ncbi:MAG: bifunctional folylpolyglutamate synthase/dihydrofolate synthase [Chlorobiaceae bacterium]|nr:bifunctional folylpolyglutamate synthase/dihydrofolate synthase [Chlorobiaceae bacterium]
MDYQEAIDFLYPLHRFGIRPGLDRIQLLLRELGNPEKLLGRVVHIAGTNGKGTVAACMASIFTASGRKTGLFTSPHLVDFTERIRIDGRQIPRERIAGYCTRLKGLVTEIGATFFEVTTAMALAWFAEEGVEASVIETGMGGRLDATNAVAGDIVIIPSIGLDHTVWLGDTVQQIAAEKAAIIKPGSKVFTAVDDPEAFGEIVREAAMHEAPLYVAGRDASFTVSGVRPARLSLEVTLDSAGGRELDVPLTGSFHASNVTLAVMAARSEGIGWSDIETGLSELAASGYRARLEQVSTRPIVMLDVSHNPAGMEKSFEALREIRGAFRDLYVLIGVAADKDAAGIVRPVGKLARMVATVGLPTERSLSPEALAGLCRDAGVAEVQVCGTVVQGFDLLCSKAKPDDLILVTGSFFLAGALIAADRGCGKLSGAGA